MYLNMMWCVIRRMALTLKNYQTRARPTYKRAEEQDLKVYDFGEDGDVSCQPFFVHVNTARARSTSNLSIDCCSKATMSFLSDCGEFF